MESVEMGTMVDQKTTGNQEAMAEPETNTELAEQKTKMEPETPGDDAEYGDREKLKAMV